MKRSLSPNLYFLCYMRYYIVIDISIGCKSKNKLDTNTLFDYPLFELDVEKLLIKYIFLVNTLVSR